ncbi:hypothetical protein [Actinoplanes subglobosus]
MRTLTGKAVRGEARQEGPHGHRLLPVMGAFAEYERALILERQREGIAVAGRRHHRLPSIKARLRRPVRQPHPRHPASRAGDRHHRQGPSPLVRLRRVLGVVGRSDPRQRRPTISAPVGPFANLIRTA